MSEFLAEDLDDGQRVVLVKNIDGTTLSNSELLAEVVVDLGDGTLQRCIAVKDVGGGGTGVLRYKGSVATYDDLPDTDNQVGDVWNVIDTGKNYAWDGTNWDDLGGTTSVSIASASDVDLQSLENGQILVYNNVTGKWENKVQAVDLEYNEGTLII